ncbi:Mitochondrial import inner membrane translocase subunit Tim23 [Galemys pyrenaicus]|uniref:Mitochondrial import inner membrane translocase subunit Tim23 n=1 Tax=Galemys pyrenaicus TaxID=202257 RepID=A0A8J6DVT3_GALPY|nr:Mitochondrial import inner membrane translocase subunit Tim23 [Galemys pyrenaicus]
MGPYESAGLQVSEPPQDEQPPTELSRSRSPWKEAQSGLTCLGRSLALAPGQRPPAPCRDADEGSEPPVPRITETKTSSAAQGNSTTPTTPAPHPAERRAAHDTHLRSQQLEGGSAARSPRGLAFNLLRGNEHPRHRGAGPPRLAQPRRWAAARLPRSPPPGGERAPRHSLCAKTKTAGIAVTDWASPVEPTIPTQVKAAFESFEVSTVQRFQHPVFKEKKEKEERSKREKDFKIQTPEQTPNYPVGSLALLCSAFGVIIEKTRGAEDDLNVVAAGIMTGMLYKSTGGLRGVARDGLVVLTAAAAGSARRLCGAGSLTHGAPERERERKGQKWRLRSAPAEEGEAGGGSELSARTTTLASRYPPSRADFASSARLSPVFVGAPRCPGPLVFPGPTLLALTARPAGQPSSALPGAAGAAWTRSFWPDHGEHPEELSAPSRVQVAWARAWAWGRSRAWGDRRQQPFHLLSDPLFQDPSCQLPRRQGRGKRWRRRRRG